MKPKFFHDIQDKDPKCYLLCSQCKIRYFFGDHECPGCKGAKLPVFSGSLVVDSATVGYIKTGNHRDWFTLRDGSKYEFIFGSPSSEWASIDGPPDDSPMTYSEWKDSFFGKRKVHEKKSNAPSCVICNPPPPMPLRMKIVSETKGFVTSKGSLGECFEWYQLTDGAWKPTHLLHEYNWLLNNQAAL